MRFNELLCKFHDIICILITRRVVKPHKICEELHIVINRIYTNLILVFIYIRDKVRIQIHFIDSEWKPGVYAWLYLLLALLVSDIQFILLRRVLYKVFQYLDINGFLYKLKSSVYIRNNRIRRIV